MKKKLIVLVTSLALLFSLGVTSYGLTVLPIDPGPAPPPELNITDWSGKDFTKGKATNMTITCDGPLYCFKSVTIDGNLIDSPGLTTGGSNTIIEIDKTHLNTLSAGQHDVLILYDGNYTVSGQFTVFEDTEEADNPNSPKGPAYVDSTPPEPSMDEPTKSDPSTSLLYAILNWTGKDFVKNQTESMVVRCDGPFNLYSSVEIDGVVLDSSLVKVSEGSTIVDINVAYLNKLAVGQHKLTVNFSDGGKAEGTFTVSDKGAVTKKSPKTGDSSAAMIALGLVVLSGATLAVARSKKSKI